MAFQCTARPVLRYVDHFDTGGDAVLLSACKLSLEGIVSKQAQCAATSQAVSDSLDQGQVPGGP